MDLVNIYNEHLDHQNLISSHHYQLGFQTRAAKTFICRKIKYGNFYVGSSFADGLVLI